VQVNKFTAQLTCSDINFAQNTVHEQTLCKLNRDEQQPVAVLSSVNVVKVEAIPVTDREGP
jgi:hypothetical protein